jgi:hypothetical protein
MKNNNIYRGFSRSGQGVFVLAPASSLTRCRFDCMRWGQFFLGRRYYE